jgi:Fe-Mn family superoxide dismutase
VKFAIPPLPYPNDALQPVLSATALEVHYEKHHKGYVEKLRKLIEGTPQEKHSLLTLVHTSDGDVFNNAAQVWNHSFFWRCMRPRGGGVPERPLLDELEAHFGSFSRFRTEFADAANQQFGSGWAWLVQEPSGALEVYGTSDAENPIRRGAAPLLTLDVWEHAYYLDYRNERARFVDGFLDRLVDWSFAAANLAAARERGEEKQRAGTDEARNSL